MTPARRVALLGYSGGGALAMLLAAGVPETAAVRVELLGHDHRCYWAEAPNILGALDRGAEPEIRR